MSYTRTAGGATFKLCVFLFSIAVFLLWASLAAGAAYILLQLPDVWTSHSGEESSRYAVMSITAYALIVGALFLVFAAGSIERLIDAVKAARSAIRHVRRMRLRIAPVHAGAQILKQG